MELGNNESFPPEVVDKLKTYVYRLIDPRNGETFYIGKGTSNRVFAHARAQIEGDELDDKLKRIREITLAGFEVAHVIHRHGMDEVTAIEVEASLIDAYPGLTNIVGGAGSSDFGVMHAKEIISRYCAAPAVFMHKAILINVNRTASETSLYEATRYAWKISKSKAEEAEFILATLQGLIVGAFIADQWLEATPQNFPGRVESPGRLGFVGREAPEAIKQQYVGKRVPDEFRKRGAANPIKYTWGKKKIGKKADPAVPLPPNGSEQIGNGELALANIPLPDANWEAIETFALTFDGYAAWESPDKCGEIANARLHGSLKELRTCLFFEQRRWHHFGEEPDEEAMEYICRIVTQIRERVGAGQRE